MARPIRTSDGFCFLSSDPPLRSKCTIDRGANGAQEPIYLLSGLIRVAVSYIFQFSCSLETIAVHSCDRMLSLAWADVPYEVSVS